MLTKSDILERVREINTAIDVANYEQKPAFMTLVEVSGNLSKLENDLEEEINGA